jgi:hypothetical protein
MTKKLVEKLMDLSGFQTAQEASSLLVVLLSTLKMVKHQLQETSQRSDALLNSLPRKQLMAL